MSICWNCRNARADRCAWIANKKEVWESACKEKRGINWELSEVWTVQECNHFHLDEKLIDRRTVQPKQPKPPVKARKNKNRRDYKHYTPEEDAQIISLREEGVPCREIAIELNRHISSVYKRISLLRETKEAERDGGEETRTAAT